MTFQSNIIFSRRKTAGIWRDMGYLFSLCRSILHLIKKLHEVVKKENIYESIYHNRGLEASTLQTITFTFDVDKYTPLNAEQSDESLQTESNGSNCHPFIWSAVIILHVTILPQVHLFKLVLSCAVQSTHTKAVFSFMVKV